jgi:hypothetical protein
MKQRLPAAALCALVLVSCANGSPMDVKGCAILSSRVVGSDFVAEVLDRSEKPVTSFSVMAATVGSIVIGNGDHIVNYDIPQRITPNEWTQISVKNRYGVRSFSACTVSHVTFADGTVWSMPTPEF